MRSALAASAGFCSRLLLLACGLLLAASAYAYPGLQPVGGASAKSGSTADHSRFKQLQGPFKSGPEVTDACQQCHTEAPKQVMETRHWTWDYTNPRTGQRLGKMTMLNSFCVGNRSNEAFCTSCHIGYGWKDDKFDFLSERNVDCLVCHDTTGKYKKPAGLAGHPAYERTEYPPGSGKFLEPVDLDFVARHVGKSRRENCGACHYNGGGGDGVKHGDLDSSLNKATRALDVHMDKDGLNFSCATCHQTESHKVAGSRVAPTAADPHGPLMRGKHEDRNPATCQACHGDKPHKGTTGGLLGSVSRGDQLNAHTRSLACQTCHIPEFARGGVPTKMSWDYSTAGRLDASGKPMQIKDDKGHVIYDSRKGDFVLGENVIPVYRWFDGTVVYTLQTDKIDPTKTVSINRFHGTPGAADARIWPVKVFQGNQPYDKVNRTLLIPHTAIPDDTAYWYNFDWDKALRAGAEAGGPPFSGEYGFVKSEMLWPITHMVAPKEQALNCVQCHSAQGRLKNVPGVWLPAQDRIEILDLAGFGLAGLALLGVLGHAGLRFTGYLRRKKA